MDRSFAKLPTRAPALIVAVATPRRDAYRAAADSLRSYANLSWTEALHRIQGVIPPDALLVFADDFKMIDAYGAIERELLAGVTRCVVVVARHRTDYQSLFGVLGATERLRILPAAGWELEVRDVIRASLEAPDA